METAPRSADTSTAPAPTGGAPAFGNPSPTAGSSTSAKANAAADAAAYQEVPYKNAKKKGPALIVIPGEIKSNNASFTQRFLPNNVADYAELELSQANFSVLERSNLGPLLNEITLAYNLGNVASARKTMQMGSSRPPNGF
jgi:curli biogenesis system outer membrane secretion channel CsgG